MLSLSWTAHAAFVIADLGPSVATALNSSGQVVGYTGTPLGPQAFLYSNGSMQNLGSLDGRGSEAFDINDRGQVVGWSTSSQGAEAFVYSGGSMQGLGVQAGYQSSQATGINNSGQVVGFSYTGAPNYPAQAFLYSAGGVIQALPTLGLGNSTYPASIGSAGQVVGGAAPDGYERPFLLENGTARLLSTGAGKALGVNDSGQVVGYADSMTGSGYRAFVYSNGNLQFLGQLSNRLYEDDYGNAINNFGQVVGQLEGKRAFLYSGSTMYDLSTMLVNGAGWTLTTAVDINDSGQIVGQGLLDGQAHAFLLTPVPPVPLPSAFGLMLAGLSAMGWAFVRSQRTI